MLPEREELQRLLKKANQHAVSQAKKLGASIYYIENDKRIREDASGRKFEITFDEDGQRVETASHE